MWLQVDKFDQRNVELLPHTMDMMSDTELTQYYIQSWSLNHRNNAANNMQGEVVLCIIMEEAKRQQGKQIDFYQVHRRV